MCDCTGAKVHSLPRSNRYSEEIAKHLGVAEDVLLASLENLICEKCQLIYKSHWFESSVLNSLFNDLIPIHPRGWDTVSGRFSAETFFREMNLYRQALKLQDVENINRYRRALSSILDSIRSADIKFDRDAALKHIASGSLDYFKDAAEDIIASFGKPEPFKRFSGHASEALWEHAAAVAQPVRSYAEIGCPLWGMFRLAINAGARPVYVKKAEINFWTEKCRVEKMNCLEKCSSIMPDVKVTSWNELKLDKVDLIGVFQYIDHLEHPLAFFQELFERAKAVVTVIDDADKSPSYIQHFTGWTPHAIGFVADTFGKQVDNRFTSTQAAGHSTFIFH